MTTVLKRKNRETVAERDMEWLRVYLITDRTLFPDHEFLKAIDLALAGGIRALQLREKDLSPRDLLALAQKVKQRTDAHGAALFINDRADIAKMVNAEGVHLTESSPPVKEVRKHFPDLRIGVSTHSLEGGKIAEQDGADFITFSPVFETPSKKEYGPPQGVDRLQNVCREIRIPVLALGGIRRDRIPVVLESGAFGVALISGIWTSSNIKQESLEYMKFFGRRDPNES